MLSERDDIGDTFKKISAWGTAVEEERPSDAALQVLRDLQGEDPALLENAVALAEQFQTLVALPNASPDLPEDSPSHPLTRIARIHTLREILGITDKQSVFSDDFQHAGHNIDLNFN